MTRKCADACEAVESSGVAEQRAVALFAHIGHDALDGGQHSIERRAATIFQRGEKLCCLPCAAAFGPDQFSFVASGSEHDLVERILDDARCLGCLELGNHVAGHALFDDGVDRDPVGVTELGDGGRVERGQHGENRIQIGATAR